MVKVVNNTILIGNSELPLVDGEHTIYLNNANGQYYLDNKSTENDVKIALYTYDSKTKDLDIEFVTENFEYKQTNNWLLGRSMWTNNRIHSGPLYGSGDVDTPVSGYLEGLPVDFNYESFVFSTLALATYVWAGGRSCFSSIFLGGVQTNVPYYTARPLMPCAEFTPKMEFELGPIAISFPLAVLDAMLEDATNYIMNMFSLVFFQYSHRRYTDFQINTKDMYSFKIEGKEISVSPLGGQLSSSTSTLPDFNASLSMFNLMQ